MAHFSDSEKALQENLSKKRLAIFKVDETIREQVNDFCKRGPNRPHGFSDIVLWATSLVYFLKPELARTGLQSFIHNAINMDGAFVQFCEEKKIKIRTLLNDSISSWDAEESERFVAMGIFEITLGKMCFYHCALFHKGNQYEDEVAFFNLVNPDNFEKYLDLRNEYIDWSHDREREVLEVEVIGGDPIPYDNKLTWDNIVLEASMKEQLQRFVSGFLQSKDLYEKLGVPWRRGAIFWGPRGCGKTSALKVIMSEYKDLKPVTIQPGSDSPDELLDEAFAYASDHSPALLYFEDIQELIKTIDVSHLLQLLDGIQNTSGILTIATGNDLSNMEENLTNRPRRFDRKFEFKLPSVDLSTAYLNRYFADILPSNRIEVIAKKSVSKKFAYVHLQEIYFNAVTFAIQNGRETPCEKDVDKAFEEVVSDKKAADSDFAIKNLSLSDEEDKDDD